MNNIEVCQKVLAEGCHLVRYRKGSNVQARLDCIACHGSGTANGLPCAQCKTTGHIVATVHYPEYDAKPSFTGSKRGWIMLDSFTAGAIVAVYNALAKTQTPENLAKIHGLPFNKLASFAFKHVKVG